MTRRDAGFTLIEVVIALAVMALGLFGVVSVIAYTNRMNVAAHEQALAMRAAERKIEQMLSCSNFDDIFVQFANQTEGFGWEQVGEMDSANVMHYLKPLSLTAAQLTLPNGTGVGGAGGYVCPTPDPRATLFVRFPLDPSTPVIPTGSTEPAWAGFVEAGLGTFMGLMDNTQTAVTAMDLNGNGTTTDKFYYSLSTPSGQPQPTPPSGYTALKGALKLLPVWIEVHWSGAAGPSHLVYKYTFYRRN